MPDYPVIDGHTHFNQLECHDAMLADLERSGIGPFCILVIERILPGADNFKLAHALWFKHKYPQRVFVFGSLDFTGVERGQFETPLEAQLQRLIACGCDGLKLLTGKPDRRKSLRQPLDSPLFDGLLSLCEETQFPVLWHVADPPEFWFAERVPLWAKQNRWWYDETHPSKETIDAEIAGVFRKHPRLNLILPHFFFTSQNLDAAAKLLDAYPSCHLDLAPGVEMFHNFTANHERARAFFVKYAGRIVFGTDIGIGRHETGPLRGRMIRDFLETDRRYQVPDDPFMTPDPRPDLHGIKLPADALRAIYCDNFQRIAGAAPRPLNHAAVKDLLRGLEAQSIRRGEGPCTAGRVLSACYG